MIKEELKGRRAAVEARYAEELKAITSDLDEIETLERVAHAFAVEHVPDATEADAPQKSADRLAALEPDNAEAPNVEFETEAQLKATRAPPPAGAYVLILQRLNLRPSVAI